MALLFMDGFDHYATADITKKWSSAGTDQTISASSGRRNGGALDFGSGASRVALQLPSPVATLIFGFAYYTRFAGAVSVCVAMLKESGAGHISFGYNASNKIEIRRGTSYWNGTFVAEGTAVLAVGAWHYIECKITIHDTAGAITIKINGVADITLTGIDTRTAGTGVIDALWLAEGGSTGAKNLYDDLYICDTTGTVNNDFLGDVRIDTLLPNGDGTYTDFTPNTGTDHYSRVAEGAPDTTTYVTSSTVDQKDTYTFQDLTAVTGNILGIQVSNAALKDDAGSRSIANVVRSGTTDAVGSTVALSTSQLIYSSIHETDPNTSAAWTEAGVNAMQAGVKVAV